MARIMDEDVEKSEPSCTAGGKVATLENSLAKSLAIPQMIKLFSPPNQNAQGHAV